ncbi:SLBB domain-containing protein [bacterium]|nr:SLBB domain-containing protein [bacterium]
MNRHIRVYPAVAWILLLFMQASWAQFGRISHGDILDIVIYNRPELSKTVTVRDDGTVDYPFVANIPIDALTLSEFRDLLITQVTKYMGEKPIITVQYSRRPSIQVVVLGQVNQPGEILVPQNATIQGAITLAGGLTSQAELNRIKIIRGQKEPRDTLYADLYVFSVKGDPGLLPPLQEGDIVFVPGLPGISDVKVIGEVRSPGNITVPPGTSLLDVLYLAGGPSQDADLNRIRLYDAKIGREQIVALDKMVAENAFQSIPGVNPGNVIVVEKKSRFWKNMFDGLRAVTSVAVPIIMILYYTGTLDRK